MPEMNCVELARSLHALAPKLRVIYMSGYTANLLDSGTSAEGVGGLLTKPFTRVALLTHIRQTLGATGPHGRAAGFADDE